MTLNVDDPSEQDRYVRVRCTTEMAHLTPSQARRIAARLESTASEVDR